jgi:tetratricopeptide (TPR) repeat protein
MQTWLATNAKALFEQSLQINPNNDSVQVELGACYLFGNISSTPMDGILKIKQVTDRDPNNMYAQLMLGLGDIKSGQYDKAIERLQLVAKKEPDNLQAVFNLAETFERKGDKSNAVAWYRKVENMINIPEAKQEIEQRIKTLE